MVAGICRNRLAVLHDDYYYRVALGPGGLEQVDLGSAIVAVFLLWAMYSGYLILRANLEDPQQNAHSRGVGRHRGSDMPMIVLATRWFRGMHPVSPQMEPLMRAALALSIAAFTLLFTLLLSRRRKQLDLARRIASLEQDATQNI